MCCVECEKGGSDVGEWMMHGCRVNGNYRDPQHVAALVPKARLPPLLAHLADIECTYVEGLAFTTAAALPCGDHGLFAKLVTSPIDLGARLSRVHLLSSE